MKEIQQLNSEGNWDEQYKELTNELRENKNTARKQYYDTLEKKKDLINKHENVVLLDKKIRKMQKLLDFKKKETHETTDNKTDDNKKIDDLNYKVQEATKTMENEEKRLQMELHRQESEISSKQHELEIAALKFREKDQEYRL